MVNAYFTRKIRRGHVSPVELKQPVWLYMHSNKKRAYLQANEPELYMKLYG
jgi:hypothetical protein